MRHWRREGPPLYIAAAAYLGLRNASASNASPLQGDDLMNFLRAFPGGEANT
jgi:hypothetical protein